MVISPAGPVVKTAGSNIYFVCELTGISQDSEVPYLQWRRENGDVIVHTKGRYVK